MPVLLEIVAMLTRGAVYRWLPNKSINLNILAITVGVAFLAFALAIYDGYRTKVERIIYSLTPHVMVRPAVSLGGDDEVVITDKQRCLETCRRPFAVLNPKDKSQNRAAKHFEPQDLAAIDRWLASERGGAVDGASRVLFEETKLVIEHEGFATGDPRPMRLLGIGRITGALPAPRVDLIFSDEGVAGRFAGGNGVIISDALAQEIEKVQGHGLVPGQTRLRLGAPGALREYELAGIHRLGIHAISRNLVIAPYEIAAELLGPAGSSGPSYVGVTLRDPQAAKAIAGRIRAEAGEEGRMAAVAWQSVTDLFDQLALYRAIILVTLLLSILVTAINTFINVNILVMDRAEQIGIMRTMGLKPSSLLLAFMGVGLLQSLAGTIIGYLLGIWAGFALDDYINALVRDFIPISGARIELDPSIFFYALLFVSLVSVVTCYFAGRRALGNEIIENLRSL